MRTAAFHDQSTEVGIRLCVGGIRRLAAGVAVAFSVVMTLNGMTRDPAADPLEGTAWQLVKFHRPKAQAVTPDSPEKYVIRFASGGQVTLRVDCNRGQGSWKIVNAKELRLGPLAMTRAKCPAGSLHDLFVKQWPTVRSYSVKGGHLFLSLRNDAGAFEFEPIKSTEKLRQHNTK